MTEQQHVNGAIRHAEKRRISTCNFADRIAKVSKQVFHKTVPLKWREQQKHTCIATIIAHFEPSLDNDELGHIQVMGLGVGTKFLSEDLIRLDESEINNRILEDGDISLCYGQRVRDSHAEVLARRAFRRSLTLEMISLINDSSTNGKDLTETGVQVYRRILKLTDCSNHDNHEEINSGSFTLLDGVTFHMYASSAPCGNSTLKKFAKMSKERYKKNLSPDQWPQEIHEPVPAHSLKFGQFALLVKRDTSSQSEVSTTIDRQTRKDGASHSISLPKKQKCYPAFESDEWCPPGTSTVHLNRGSIHTCSDKLCRVRRRLGISWLCSSSVYLYLTRAVFYNCCHYA